MARIGHVGETMRFLGNALMGAGTTANDLLVDYALPYASAIGRTAFEVGRGANTLERGYRAITGAGKKKPKPSYRPPLRYRRSLKGVQSSYLTKELKYLDTAILFDTPATTMSSNGDIIPLNLTEQGTGPSQRDGRRIFMKKIRIQGNFYYTYDGAPTAAPWENLGFRVALVYDAYPGGLLPSKSTIFTSTESDGTQLSTWKSNANMNEMDRFQIIFDSFLKLEPNSIRYNLASSQIGDIQVSKPFTLTRNLAHTTTYRGTSTPAGIANVSTGGLYIILMFPNNGLASLGNKGSVKSSLTARLTFTS